MNARSLAGRDAAVAALVGALPSDFGHEATFGNFGAQFGHFGAFGADDALAGLGVAAPAAAAATAILANPRDPRHPLNPANQANMIAMWQQKIAVDSDRAARMSIIDPNANSDLKIMRYSFSASTALVLGTTSVFPSTFAQNPQVAIRPQRVMINAPQVNFGLITDIKVANVSVLVGGTADAFEYNANGVGASLDLPLIGPQNTVTVVGSYSGFTPAGFTAGAAFTLIASFKGPATITPGGGLMAGM